METEEKKFSLFLTCPSVSKKVQINIPSEDQKLDLGSISRVFELEPTSVKLNGHFISRGADFIASSVTWKSLIGYFSARGFPAGVTDSGALVVDGKLPRIGSKRLHGLEDDGNGVLYTNEQLRDCKKPQLERCSGSLMNRTNWCREFNSLSLKRKSSLEGECDFKRMRKANEAVSGHDERKDSSGSGMRRFSCNFISSNNVKRIRDDDMVDAFPVNKKIR